MVGSLERCANSVAVKQELTNANSPKRNGAVERALAIVQKAAVAASIQAPIIFPLVQLPSTDSLWAQAVHSIWLYDAMNHTATTTANPGNKSPREMWHGTAAPTSLGPFFRPTHCRWNRPFKASPRA